MKRGLKVKSGVRAPAPIVFPLAGLFSSRVVTPTLTIHELSLPDCPNNKPGDGCWYCIQRGAK